MGKTGRRRRRHRTCHVASASRASPLFAATSSAPSSSPSSTLTGRVTRDDPSPGTACTQAAAARGGVGVRGTVARVFSQPMLPCCARGSRCLAPGCVPPPPSSPHNWPPCPPGAARTAAGRPCRLPERPGGGCLKARGVEGRTEERERVLVRFRACKQAASQPWACRRVSGHQSGRLGLRQSVGAKGASCCARSLRAARTAAFHQYSLTGDQEGGHPQPQLFKQIKEQQRAGVLAVPAH